ncbi:MAG: TonB-dependent receptor [Caulobacteraceae bacterium]
MNRKSYARAALFAGAAMSALTASEAYAQAAAQAKPGGQALEEVVVTATRQTSSVNRVALSIAAVTQQSLDQQGLKQATDLVRTVPGLTTSAGAPAQTGLATFAIRGIVANVGAATTGVYLDDTSLTRRNNAGVNQNPGAAQPVLFDLARVEVLKGPQGTLYGGSSEGGTIRFITPQPSLTTYSGAARAETGFYTGGGEPSWELGAAAGGPIVQDKLGLRLSGVYRVTGGWVNLINPYTGTSITDNANENKQWSFRAQGLWQVNDRASVAASYYHSDNTNRGGPSATTDLHNPDGSVAPANQTWTTPQTCYNISAAPTGAPQSALTGINGTAFVPTRLVAGCPANAVAGQTVNGVYARPAATYGPYNLGKRDALATAQLSASPGYARADVGSITLNYHFEHMDVKSITSYVDNHNYNEAAGGEDPVNQQRTTLDATHAGFPLWLSGGDYPGHFQAHNDSNGIEQELRFTSPADQRPLNWVAGIYVEDTHLHPHYEYRNTQANADRTQNLFWGITSAQRYGTDNDCNCQAYLDATITDTQFAGFGEGNYWITDKLKLNTGVRITRLEISYYQLNYGQFSGRVKTNPLSLTQGASVDSPVTPKFGVEYDFTPSRIVYATAAQGFRAGGVNPQVSQQICQTGLDLLGITATTIPNSYNSDKVWSYEVGGKFRLLDNKLQVNAAAYLIDWSGVQTTVTITGCGQSFVINGGKARSQGIDFQAQYKPINPVTLELNVGYDDAHYIDPVKGPPPVKAGATALPLFNAKDPIGVPPWQVSGSVQYDFTAFGKFDAYVRADDQFVGAYTSGASFGVSAYNPFQRYLGSQNIVNTRAGVRVGTWDLNVYALNVLDSRQKTGTNAGNGITACAAPSLAAGGGFSSLGGGTGCSTYTNWSPFVGQLYQRPRVVGVQANYRF